MEETKEKNSGWGGKRPGAGKPTSGRAHKTYWVTPEEDVYIKKYLEKNKEKK